jgi:hypothetical protein
MSNVNVNEKAVVVTAEVDILPATRDIVNHNIATEQNAIYDGMRIDLAIYKLKKKRQAELDKAKANSRDAEEYKRQVQGEFKKLCAKEVKDIEADTKKKAAALTKKLNKSLKDDIAGLFKGPAIKMDRLKVRGRVFEKFNEDGYPNYQVKFEIKEDDPKNYSSTSIDGATVTIQANAAIKAARKEVITYEKYCEDIQRQVIKLNKRVQDVEKNKEDMKMAHNERAIISRAGGKEVLDKDNKMVENDKEEVLIVAPKPPKQLAYKAKKSKSKK